MRHRLTVFRSIVVAIGLVEPLSACTNPGSTDGDGASLRPNQRKQFPRFSLMEMQPDDVVVVCGPFAPQVSDAIRRWARAIDRDERLKTAVVSECPPLPPTKIDQAKKKYYRIETTQGGALCRNARHGMAYWLPENLRFYGGTVGMCLSQGQYEFLGQVLPAVFQSNIDKVKIDKLVICGERNQEISGLTKKVISCANDPACALPTGLHKTAIAAQIRALAGGKKSLQVVGRDSCRDLKASEAYLLVKDFSKPAAQQFKNHADGFLGEMSGQFLEGAECENGSKVGFHTSIESFSGGKVQTGMIGLCRKDTSTADVVALHAVGHAWGLCDPGSNEETGETGSTCDPIYRSPQGRPSIMSATSFPLTRSELTADDILGIRILACIATEAPNCLGFRGLDAHQAVANETWAALNGKRMTSWSDVNPAKELRRIQEEREGRHDAFCSGKVIKNCLDISE